MLAADSILTWYLISLTCKSRRSSRICLNLTHFTLWLFFYLLPPLCETESMQCSMPLCSLFAGLEISSNSLLSVLFTKAAYVYKLFQRYGNTERKTLKITDKIIQKWQVNILMWLRLDFSLLPLLIYLFSIHFLPLLIWDAAYTEIPKYS